MTEQFFSGYCRQLDAPRMVELVTQAGQIEEVDCCYGNCQFQSACPIAQAIADYLNN